MFSLHEGAHIPVVDPSAADGAFSLLWLVVALPALGAVLLLVGGPLVRGRFDRWGPLLGTVRSAPAMADDVPAVQRQLSGDRDPSAHPSASSRDEEETS